MKTRLTITSFGLASAAATFLLVWPVYSAFDGRNTTHATLMQVNGSWAILPVLFPVFLAFLPLVFRKQALRTMAAVVMLAFSFISGFTIGLFRTSGYCRAAGRVRSRFCEIPQPTLVRAAISEIPTHSHKRVLWSNDFMRRAEFVQKMVLNEICDDFENLDQIILPNVAEYGRKCGLTIERAEIVEAMSALVGNGLAKAYDLACTDPFSKELPGMPSMDIIEEGFRTHFYATKNGLDLQSSYRSAASWPFDDEGELRCDWRSPESWA